VDWPGWTIADIIKCGQVKNVDVKVERDNTEELVNNEFAPTKAGRV
jgi:hypothetical protein